MSDENTQQTEVVVPETTTQTGQIEQHAAQQPENDAQSMLDGLSQEELIGIIKDTRSEAKKHRLKKKALEEQLGTIESEKKQAAEDALRQQGEFEKLYGDLKNNVSDYDELKEFKANFLNNCKAEIEDVKNGLTNAETELFELSAKHMPYDEQLQFIKKMVSTRSTAQAIIDKTQSVSRSNNEEADPELTRVPFGSGSLSNKVLSGLKKLRS